MTPQEQRAHDILRGQTLAQEWATYLAIRAEAHKLWADAVKAWVEAVKVEFGPACTITWTAEGCSLSVGESYFYQPEK